METLVARALEDARLARRSFEVAAATWIGVTVACVALTIVATWVGDRIGGHPGYLFGELRLEGLYAGMMTAVTAFFLGAAGISLFTVAWLLARDERERSLALPWTIAAAGLFVLGADDLLFVHEILAFRLEDRGVPRAIGDNLALGIYILGTLLVLPRLIETVRRYWRALFPLLFSLSMLALSVFVEIVIPATPVAGVVDRSGKLAGCVMMFAFAQTLLIGVAGDLRKS